MDAWLDTLDGRLPGHAALLRSLLDLCRADRRIRVLELQCSIARGAGDELSDLDLGVAAVDDVWEAVAADLADRLQALAETVQLVSHLIPEWGTRPHRRIFVQYLDGRQIDLVVQPASAVRARVPGAVVLHDPDGRLAEERIPAIASATAADIREWDGLAWELLANVWKYLERGSAWEALARLTTARDLALRLYAAAERVAYPSFGLTALLDADPPRLPPGLERTASRADLPELARAARACADLLRAASASARRRLDPGAGESPMADWVTERLDTVAARTASSA